MLSWSNLPSESFQNILNNLSYLDLNNLLLVCKSWFMECDYFLKDKTILHISKISSTKEAGKSGRRFENIHIVDCNQLSVDIIESLKGRNIKYGGKFTSAFIRYSSYDDLQSILKSIGKELRVLHLKNKVRNSCSLNFPTLSLVEELKIECFNQSIETIAPFFSNLKVLDIRADLKRVTQSLIKEFLTKNSKLEKLYYNEIWVTFDGEPIFKDNQNLKVLKTDNSELSSIAFKSVLPMENFESNCSKFKDDDLKIFRKNFKDLKKLSLFEDVREFTEKGFSEIWTFPKLNILELMNFRLSNLFWKNALFKSHNHELTSLSLISIHLNDDLIEMCTRSTPNIKHFKANMWAFTSFRSIQEMGENWKNLETFEFMTPVNMSYDEDRLKYPFDDTHAFRNLKKLHLSCDFQPEIQKFFKHFKASNLKTAILEMCFWSELQSYKETVELFSRNNIQVEVLELRDMNTINSRTVKIVCENLRNLKSLTLEGTSNLSVEVVGTVLDSSKSIKEFKMIDFEEMFLESETISLEAIYKPKNSKLPALKENRIKSIEKMCQARNPPIEPQHFNTISRLFSNGVEVLLGKYENMYCISDIEDDDEEEEEVESDYSVQSDTDSEDEGNNEEENENDDSDDYVVYEDSDSDEEAPNAKRRREM